MTETGFSIRCPHCFEWSDWFESHPKDVVLSTTQHQEEVLHGLAKDPLKFSHKKMFVCKDPGGRCPAPFQAFILPDERTAHWFVEQVPTWAIRRAFRLAKTDHKNRWEPYSGIIFCTRPVPRLKHIDLQQLLDPEVLSRALVGISLELNAPITVYAAKVFETDNKSHTYWIPIEGYTKDIRIVPPRYNLFCNACRSAEINFVLTKFEGNSTQQNCSSNVPKNNHCNNDNTPCTKNAWNGCPAFLEARKELHMCYWSDCNLIDRLEKRWASEVFAPEIYETQTCWAGFQEIAAPVVVHEHLIAVAMTGQFVLKKSQVPDNNHLIREYPILEPYRDRLEIARNLLLGNRKPTNERETYTTLFCVSKKEFDEKAKSLTQNTQRLAEVSKPRYRDLRSNSEVAFKEELLGRIEVERGQHDSFRQSVLAILDRMREFWAFKSTYFLEHNLETKKVSMRAFSLKREEPVFFAVPMILGLIEPDLSRSHPLPRLYDRSEKQVCVDPWAARFREIFEKALNYPQLGVPDGRYYFLVLVPFADEIPAFLFAARDEEAVSPLRSHEKGSVSELCQERMLETCSAAIGKLYEFKYQETRESIMAAAWRSFSVRMAHKIDNRLFAARGALRRQREANADFVGIKELGSALERIGLISNDFRRFVTDQPLNVSRTNVEDLIVKEVAVYKQAAPNKRININISGPLPECKWDSVQISQAIGELLENAITYSPPIAAISIETESFTKDSTPMVRITICNEGPGIDYADKKRIFEPFFTTSPEGAGLGLAIVAKIIEAHKGKIDETGEPGKNSMFVLELPAKPEKEEFL